MNELNRADVLEYLQQHLIAAKAERRIKQLKQPLLDAIIAGSVSPKDLPFLLVNRPQNRPQSDWKGACLDALRKLLKSPARAEKRIEEIEAGWETKEIPSLIVIPNPDYQLSPPGDDPAPTQ